MVTNMAKPGGLAGSLAVADSIFPP
jgi:hypothetical protein